MYETETTSPSEYFERVKERKSTMTDRKLARAAANCLVLLEKYKKTGQKKGAKKVEFYLNVFEKESQLLKMGVDTYVEREDIEEYIDNIAKDVVKIIELENYEREIPDEIVEVVEKTRGIFDEYFVVFTDYTGKVEREVEKERREKDPILFGAFENNEERVIMDRFYFLGDWVDEYCDLTLEKMASERDIIREVEIPSTVEEVLARIHNKKVPTLREKWFSKVRSVLRGGVKKDKR